MYFPQLLLRTIEFNNVRKIHATTIPSVSNPSPLITHTAAPIFRFLLERRFFPWGRGERLWEGGGVGNTLADILSSMEAHTDHKAKDFVLHHPSQLLFSPGNNVLSATFVCFWAHPFPREPTQQGVAWEELWAWVCLCISFLVRIHI